VATIRLLGTLLQIDLDDGRTLMWRVSEVRQTQGAYAGEQVRLERGGNVPEVLLVNDAALLRELRTIGGARNVRDPGRRRTRLVLTVLAAVVVVGMVAALYRWGIPAAVNIAADRVPRSWEARLGEAIVDQVAPAERRCTDPKREALIGSIVERLRATRPDAGYAFRITIVDDRQINAMAAPGGSIILLRGLLERSRTPEQLAGVLAHEMAHVMRRHTTRAILAHVSTGLLVAAVAGDVTTAAAFGVEGARTLAALAYSRSSEEEADEDGLRMLMAASIDPRGMIDFFDSMRGRDEGLGLVRYLSTHPSSGDRAERLRGIVAATPHHVAPLLPGRHWKDVAKICRS
jgi:predicted Zn-dependent protease